jgi:hypothetical protein
MAQCEDLSYEFLDFMAEALGLKKDALRIFFEPVMQHRLKVTYTYVCGFLWADLNGSIGTQVSARQRRACGPRRWPALRFRLFDVCTSETLPFWLAAITELTLKSYS